MVIREAVPADAGGIARVRVDTWRSTYRGIMPDRVLDDLSYPEIEEQFLEVLADRHNPPVFYVAENDAGEVCGFSYGGAERSGEMGYQGEIYAIYVLKEYQGQGIGLRLLEKSVKGLCERGLFSMMVWVLSENPYRRFYEKLGGRRVIDNTFVFEGNEARLTAYGWSDITSFLSE